MFRTEGQWIVVDYIFKDTIINQDAEKWEIDSAVNEADTIVAVKYILRKEIVGLEEATNKSKDTFERDDVWLLQTLHEGSIHIVIQEDEVSDFMKLVGPDYKE